MTESSNPAPHNSFDPELVAALGELTIDFATLEEVLRESIWWILGGNEERAQIMTAGLSFQTLIEKWAAPFAQKFDHVVLSEPVNHFTHSTSLDQRSPQSAGTFPLGAGYWYRRDRR